MEKLTIYLLASWFWLALIMSFYWGIRAVQLFTNNLNWHWKVYQFVFNFIGSFAGWCCFYVLLVRTQNNFPSFQSLALSDVILFVISLLGLTGHLPEVIYGFVKGLEEITRKAFEKLSK